MSKFVRLGAVASLMAVASAIATPAYAATLAGSSITNTVTVNFKVGGVDQTPKTASDSFVVDRKVNLTVVQDGTATTQVFPGGTAQVTTFLVSNLTNAAIDIALAASNRTGDAFDVSNIKIYRDNTAVGAPSIGSYANDDVEITSHLDQVAAETSNIRVFVVADIPLNKGPGVLATGEVANVRLTGTAHNLGLNPGDLGSVITETGSNTAGEDTVLADTTLGGNAARDGIHFADDGYEIVTAALSVLKSSRVVPTTLNGVTNVNAIPGATVEYCIRVSNNSAAGGPNATAVAISDTLPTETTYDSSVVGVLVGGTYDTATSTCNAGADPGVYNSGTRTVTGTIPTITPGETRTVQFRVTIN